MIRATIYAVAFVGVMLVMGLLISPWAVLALPATLFCSLAFCAAGLATTTYLRTVQDFDLPFGLVIMPMFLFSGTFFPISVYPEWLQVAVQLTHKDALAAHARDELGITEEFIARPLQAALASAISFSGGAVLPLIVGIITPMAWAVPAIYGASLIFLVALGAIGAKTGGAPAGAGALRVGFWGAIAMAVTAGIGRLFGAVV